MKFKSENTAILKGKSATAVMICEVATASDKVIDISCGTGRNMKFIKENSEVKTIHGCDIAEQLERSKKHHDILRAEGMEIFESSETPKEKYTLALNSHVLNVIPSDEIKQLVVNNIYNSLVKGGRAYIEVRYENDINGIKHKTPHLDGFHVTRTNTYQEFVTPEKMTRLVTNAGFKIIEHVCKKSSCHYIVVEK